MIFIPLKEVKKNLNLSKQRQPEKKLNRLGLETSLFEKEKKKYFEITPLTNRPDLFSWVGILEEISILLDCPWKRLTNLENVSKNRKEFQKKNSFSNDLTQTKYQEISFWTIKTTETKAKKKSFKNIQEIFLLNKKAVSNNKLQDSSQLIQIMFGGDIWLQEYSNEQNKKYQILLSKKEGKEDLKLKSFILDELSKQSKNIFGFFRYKEDLKTPDSQEIEEVFSLINNKKTKAELFYHWIRKEKEKKVSISLDFIQKKTGQKIKKETIEKKWKQLKLSFFFNQKLKKYQVRTPAHRLDLNSKEDLLAETLKINDYNLINHSRLFSSNSFPTIFEENQNKTRTRKQKIKEFLVDNGWQEVITYSLISPKDHQNFKTEKKDYFCLINPKNKERTQYRQNLISSHLSIIQKNLSLENKNLFFFEISKISTPNTSDEEQLILSSSGNIIKLPYHQLNETVDYHWLKGTLENIFQKEKQEKEINFIPNLNLRKYLKPEKNSEIIFKKETIGFLGQLKEEIAEEYGIKEPLWIAQIFLTKFWNQQQKKGNFVIKPTSNFPINKRDLSFFFPDKTDYQQVLKTIEKIKLKELQEVEIIDVFQNQEFKEKNIFSMTFRLFFQGQIQTLNSLELNQMTEKIINKIKKDHCGEVREK